MEDTPSHFGKIIDLIPLIDVIAGPLIVVSLKGNKFSVHKYEKVVCIFDTVAGIDHSIWL